MVIDRKRRRSVTASEARHVPNRYVILTLSGERLVEGLPNRAGASQMTAHISAHANIHFGWRLEVEVRVKTGDCMNLADRYLELPGQLVQLVGGQVAERRLDGPKFVKHTELLAFAVPEPSSEIVGHDTKSIGVCPLDGRGGGFEKKKCG